MPYIPNASYAPFSSFCGNNRFQGVEIFGNLLDLEDIAAAMDNLDPLDPNNNDGAAATVENDDISDLKSSNLNISMLSPQSNGGTDWPLEFQRVVTNLNSIRRKLNFD